MLAIVFGCEWFHDYLYGQREITVESNRNLLEAILKKPTYQAPLRLQKMILRIKPYAVNVKYIHGSHLVLADTLSRAYLPSQAADQPDEFEIHVLDSGQCLRLCFTSWGTRIRVNLNFNSCRKLSWVDGPDQRRDTSWDKTLLKLLRWNKPLQGVNVQGWLRNCSQHPATQNPTMHTQSTPWDREVQNVGQECSVLVKYQ